MMNGYLLNPSCGSHKKAEIYRLAPLGGAFQLVGA